MKLKPETRRLWIGLAKRDEEARNQWVSYYEASLTDYFGTGWFGKWTSWRDMPPEHLEMEKEIRILLTDCNMAERRIRTEFTRIHKAVFLKVPPKYGRVITLADMPRVRDMIAADDVGTQEQKMHRACRTIAAEKNASSRDASNKFTTKLPHAKEGENGKDYWPKILELIAEHIDKNAATLKGTASVVRLVKQLRKDITPQVRVHMEEVA